MKRAINKPRILLGLISFLAATSFASLFATLALASKAEGFRTPLSKPYQMTRRDYLELMVGNYVHGFKQFGTTAYILSDTSDRLYIEIYYNEKTQSKISAWKFKRHLEKELPYILERHEWARGIPFEITVFAESGDN